MFRRHEHGGFTKGMIVIISFPCPLLRILFLILDCHDEYFERYLSQGDDSAPFGAI